MIINFEVPSGYSYPEADGYETSVIPQKNDYVVTCSTGSVITAIALRVQKRVFECDFKTVTVVLVEEE